MKGKDLIYILCKHEASLAAADVNIILEPGEQAQEVTEDYVNEFMNQLLSNKKAVMSKGHLILSGDSEASMSHLMEQLEDTVSQGFWVYMSSKVDLHLFQWFRTKKDAVKFCNAFGSEDEVQWKGIIDTYQKKVSKWDRTEV